MTKVRDVLMLLWLLGLCWIIIGNLPLAGQEAVPGPPSIIGLTESEATKGELLQVKRENIEKEFQITQLHIQALQEEYRKLTKELDDYKAAILKGHQIKEVVLWTFDWKEKKAEKQEIKK